MSLINEALKKAQRVRNEDAGDPSFAETGGPRILRRGKADSASTMVLIGSGALVLVVLSVVATVYLVNRPTKGENVAVSTPVLEAKKASPAPLIRDDPAPPIIVPTITPAVSVPMAPGPAMASTASPVLSVSASAAKQASSSSASSGPQASPAQVGTPPSPVASAPAAASPSSPAIAEVVPTPPLPPTLSPDAPDERIAAFVEAIRVTGIRSSGAESRVLMNERVYRVNDIVERTLNVRLIKAAADNLTFSDPRGVIYIKRF